MAVCILHVGMHKTGSSSIQASLASLPETGGLHFATINAPNASLVINYAFRERPTFRKGSNAAPGMIRRRRERARKRFTEYMALHRDEDVLLSAEAMVHLMPHELDDLLQAIPHAEKRAIGYVRSPKSYMSSAAQERIKGGEFALSIEKLFPQYAALFTKFIERIPTELYHFDRARLKQGCVVQDFCSRLGIRIEPESVLNQNESLSGEAVKLIFCWNSWRHSVGLDGDTRLSVLPRLLSELRGTPFRLSSALTGAVAQKNAGMIDWVEHRLGSPFAAESPADESGAITDLDALRHPGKEAVDWLCHIVGTRPLADPTPESVGRTMQLLYERGLSRGLAR